MRSLSVVYANNAVAACLPWIYSIFLLQQTRSKAMMLYCNGKPEQSQRAQHANRSRMIHAFVPSFKILEP